MQNINMTLWFFQIILAIVFLITGGMKVFRYEETKKRLSWVKDVSPGLTRFIGFSEILGALGIVVPGLIQNWGWLVPYAALGIVLLMLIAINFHMGRGERSEIGINFLLLLFAGFVAYGRAFLFPL